MNNIFDTVAQKEVEGYFRLGNKSPDEAFRDGRYVAMRGMMKGKGFRQEKRSIGSERGEKKRAAYRRFIEDYKAEREQENEWRELVSNGDFGTLRERIKKTKIPFDYGKWASDN